MFKILKSFFKNIKKLMYENIKEIPEYDFYGTLDEFNFEEIEKELCNCKNDSIDPNCDSFACQLKYRKT